MIFRPSIVVAALAVFLTASVGAQVANSLKDAVERAVLSNPEVKFKHQNLLAAGSEQDAAKGGWRPRIDLEARAGRASTLSPGLNTSTDYNHSAATLQLRQTLFDGFATASEVRRLGHNRLTSYYELLSASDQIALETVRAYIDTLRYRELVSLARENYATHSDVYGRLESRVNAGVGRRVDLEQAAGRLALAESNWLTEVSNLHDVSTRYQRLVGEAPAATLQAPPSLTQFLPNRDGFVTNSVRANPDFLGAVSTIRAYRADTALRRSNYWPTLEFRANQSLERNRSGAAGEYRDNSVELVLNYNLYRGGSDSARVGQYIAKLNSAYELRDKTCRDVRQTALIALNDVSRLGSQIGFLAQHELSTAKAREAYRQQFDIGQRSLLDLLDTENELYEARRALINAELDHQLARARVLAVSGALLGALQLRTIQAEAPPSPVGGEDGADAVLNCSTEVPPLMVLDKSGLSQSSGAPLPAPSEPSAPLWAPPTAVGPANGCQRLTAAVEGWIAAWNKKDINAYFDAYSEAFIPPLSLTRADWETLRKKRLGKQGSIQAVLKNIEPIRCEASSAEVQFTQEYGSDNYQDVVEKKLMMALVKGQWKITRETVTKGRTF